MARHSSKTVILDAAERVIARQGLAAATIESVAAEAGMSKGGLFYHFSSKRELLMQLMERYQEEFRLTRQEIYDSLPESPGRLLKATVLASLRHPAKTQAGAMSNIFTLLDDVEIRTRVADARRALMEELSANYPHPEKIALAILATDGLWLMTVLGYSFSGETHEKITAELLRMIDIHVAEDMAAETA